MVCVVVVFVLSALTYRFVEQPFRSPRRFPVRRALTLYPAAVAVVVVGSLGGYYYSEYSSGALGDNPAITLTNFGVEDESSYDLDKDPTVALVQASVIAARHHMAVPSDLTPDLLDRPRGRARRGRLRLRARLPRALPDAATPTRDRSIVVFGNSHGRMWIPAFDQIGKELGYRTYYFVKPNCAASLVSVGELVPGSPLWPECDDFRSWALDQIATLHPDLVVVSSSGPNPVLYDASGNRIPRTARRTRPATGTSTCSPSSPRSRTARCCCATYRSRRRSPTPASPRGTPTSATACSSRSRPRSATPTSPRRPRPPPAPQVVDPTKWLCWEDQCPVVIGDMLPYRDRGHLTTVYARSLSDELIAGDGPLGGIVP